MGDARDVYDILDSVWDTRELVDLIERLSVDPDANGEALATAIDLQSEIEPYAPDYRYGEVVIRDDEFENYARQLAEDVGAIEASDRWPNYCIDWAWAARELQQDYTSFEFDDCKWWVR